MILCLLAIIVGLVGLGTAQPSNQTCSHEANKPATCLQIGDKDTFDRVLHRQEYKKTAFIFIKRDDEVVFPPGGSGSNWFTLTAVSVTNLMPKGQEGQVTLKAGGVGHQNVTLYFESQRSLGYHFLVVVRGKDTDVKKSP